MELVLVDEENEIKKSETLVKSRYKLKPLAIKLITTIISSVQDKDEVGHEYSIALQNFTDLASLKGHDYYKKIDDATNELFKPFKINIKGNDWEKVNWVHRCKYVEAEGLIKFQIHEDIFPMIKNLKKGNYLKYDLTNILKLRSEYSIRVYEWLKDEFNKYNRYNKSAEVVLTIDFIRERLEIPKSYGYSDIRKQILEKAENDLLENCDIKFEWEVAIKLRKAVHSIKFKIYPNNKNIKKSVMLPPYLNGYMPYVKHLRKKYSGKGKYFLLMQFELNGNKQGYYFGINNDNLVYAMGLQGGDSISLSKSEAEVVLNASYLGSTHSELYRDIVNDVTDFWEFSRDTEHKEFYGIVTKEITSVLKEFDARNVAMF